MKENGWQGFLKLCQTMQNPQQLSTLFDLCFTPEEKESLSLRFLIIQELIRQEKTQREIAEHLHVSIAKITRGSNELKRTPLNFIHFLKNHL